MPAPLKALLDGTLPLTSMAMQKVGDRFEYVGQVGKQYAAIVNRGAQSEK